MPVLSLPLAVTAALILSMGLCVWAVRSYLLLRRDLLRERAARRLTDAAHHRDQEALDARFREAVCSGAVLQAANEVLDSALASVHDPEGGSA